MPTYNLQTSDVKKVMDEVVAKDVLTHLDTIIGQCRFRKITKRRGFAKAAHGVAKAFGHRSAHYDLYLANPGAVRGSDREISDKDNYTHWTVISDLPSPKVYYRLMVLGKESQTDDRLGGHSVMPNQIETNVKRDFTEFWVDMELTGPALARLCLDCSKRNLWQDKIRPKLMDKWGSTGVSYGVYQTEKGDEDYRFVRLVDGVPKSYIGGWGSAPGAWTQHFELRSYTKPTKRTY